MTQRDQDIIKMYQDGMTLRQVGEKVGLTYPRIEQILMKNDIPRRTRWAYEWRPIETALKDREEVLTYRGAGLMAVAVWLPNDETVSRNNAGWCVSDGMYITDVTHWMPLPEKPLAHVKQT